MFFRIKLFLLSALLCFLMPFGTGVSSRVRVAEPQGLSVYTKSETPIVNDADFYVSVNGSDDNDGSIDAPFATIERARDAVRAMDKTTRGAITVAIKAGDYRVSSLEFTSQDSGTADCPVTYCAYGDGEVVLNGGVTIEPSMFQKVNDTQMLARLSSSAKAAVRCVNLSELGISQTDYGRIYAVGTYHTAYKYTGDTTGPLYAELFVNDHRQSLARYPDTGYIGCGKVVSTGEGYESDGSSTINKDWDTLVNPRGDVYEVSKTVARHISAWSTLDVVWMMGFWKYDWADASTPIGAYDAESRQLTTQYVSLFGTKKDAPIYFYNVFEELDCPGEWYLDRENNVLYVYPDGTLDGATIDLSLTTNSILHCKNTDYLTFRGFTIKGTRGDAVTATGNHMTLEKCLVKNVAGNAISMTGSDNVVFDNEITRTGRGGILLDGGDRTTLTPGNNRADNNLIHDWSEIYLTYQPGITLDGVGNTCSHNELYNSPHEAITYRGNDHMVEYNVIHDVCLLSDDAGAIYAGRRWDWYGNVIRYNCIYNIGSNGHTPDGIYMDDALSGQTVYGNLLVNVPKIGLHLGGGRDLDVRNNIVINTNDRPVSYDQRAADGLNGTWFIYSGPGGFMWQKLYEMPWQGEIWQNAYPGLRSLSENFDDPTNPDFAPNPAYSTVRGNLFVNAKGTVGYVAQLPMEYSDIGGNAVTKLTTLPKLFTNAAQGDYTIKENSDIYNQLPDFEPLPLSKMGRY